MWWAEIKKKCKNGTKSCLGVATHIETFMVKCHLNHNKVYALFSLFMNSVHELCLNELYAVKSTARLKQNSLTTKIGPQISSNLLMTQQSMG